MMAYSFTVLIFFVLSKIVLQFSFSRLEFEGKDFRALYICQPQCWEAKIRMHYFYWSNWEDVAIEKLGSNVVIHVLCKIMTLWSSPNLEFLGFLFATGLIHQFMVHFGMEGRMAFGKSERTIFTYVLQFFLVGNLNASKKNPGLSGNRE